MAVASTETVSPEIARDEARGFMDVLDAKVGYLPGFPNSEAPKNPAMASIQEAPRKKADGSTVPVRLDINHSAPDLGKSGLQTALTENIPTPAWRQYTIGRHVGTGVTGVQEAFASIYFEPTLRGDRNPVKPSEIRATYQGQPLPPNAPHTIQFVRDLLRSI